MILAVVFVLCLCSCGGVELAAWCEDSAGPEFSFSPAPDAVEGRYALRWCPAAAAAAPARHWQLVVWVDDRNATKCVHDPFHSHPIKHSLVSKDIDQELNCTKLCLSVDVDLVYAGCYTVRNTLQFTHENPINQQKVMYINESHTLDYYSQSEILAITEGKDDTEYVRLSSTRAPLAPGFSLELRADDDAFGSAQQVAQQCRLSSPREARCELRGLRAGRYELTLQQRAAWAAGAALPPALATIVLAFNHTAESAHAVAGAGGGWPWPWALAAGGAGAACVAAVACALRRPRRQDKGEIATTTLAAVDTEPPEPRDILLLYARDAPPFMRAMQLLRDILRDATQGEVHDIFCPATVAAYSASPGAWLRRCVASCRVVLVDTRPAAQLYTAGDDHAAPLLGSRVLYRAPQYGDALLPAALQLLRERPPPRPYRHLFLCTLSEQPSDMMPHVAHFTRYELPLALPALLRDLAPRAPAAPRAPGPAPAAPAPPPRMLEFTAALEDFLNYARDNPDYLQDILTFLD
ncbi:hypothetical protein JYU34_008388 [Plutella xylostella]|uniref:SEFIR domain-containing protein n=1 Tax=Plutella xylostella TaxID=51655 RepID=A0ABQ7QKU7_PLUXY|nr:hypothetical protein JYU34_008388 [Plutella xylostella]